MKRAIKALVVGVLAGSMLAGCMGKFALTEKIYSWNKKVDKNRWINEGVFVAFLIIPVYSLSLLADGLIFNSIDWWTGKNPIAAGDTKTIHGDDGSVAQMTMRADGKIDVAVTAASGQQSQFTLVKDGDTVSAEDASGKKLDVVTF